MSKAAPKRRKAAPKPIIDPIAAIRWRGSVRMMAGEAISLRAYWTRHFGNWQGYDVPSDVLTLAQEAAEAWAQIAEELTGEPRKASPQSLSAGIHAGVHAQAEEAPAKVGSRPKVSPSDLVQKTA
jgi:hypothetical protein